MATPARVFALLLLAASLTTGFVFLDIPGHGRFRDALQNSGHGLAFALVAGTSLLVLNIRRSAHPIGLLTSVAFVLFMLGVLIEYAQGLSGRGASLDDVGMNLLGIVAGCASTVALTRCTGSQNRPHRWRAWLFVIAFAALLWCMRYPIVFVLFDAFAPRLPVVADFEQPLALGRFGPSNAKVRLDLTEQHQAWLDNETIYLRAEFPAGRWPGFRLIEPPRDWSSYSKLALTVVNPSNQPVRLFIRIDQRNVPKDIFWTASQTLEPGFNVIQTELRTMRPDIALSDRLNFEPFKDVSQVLFFLARDQQRDVTLFFDDIRLIR